MHVFKGSSHSWVMDSHPLNYSSFTTELQYMGIVDYKDGQLDINQHCPVHVYKMFGLIQAIEWGVHAVYDVFLLDQS